MEPIAGSAGSIVAVSSPLRLTSPGIASPAGANKADFSAVLNQALQQVSLKQDQAGDYARRFQLGDTNVSLEQTMVALQTANISFQALVQVRNRVVSAYQDIMNMQV
jgi:flagellar hook-basal body complex protein FliE